MTSSFRWHSAHQMAAELTMLRRAIVVSAWICGLSSEMKPDGTRSHKPPSSHRTFGTFHCPTNCGCATGPELKAVHTHSDLRIHVSVAGSLLLWPGAPLALPACTDSDLHSMPNLLAIWIGRANTVAGPFHARDGCVGRDRIVESPRHGWPANSRHIRHRDIRIIPFRQAIHSRRHRIPAHGKVPRANGDLSASICNL